jgi:hypothetical protein
MGRSELISGEKEHYWRMEKRDYWIIKAEFVNLSETVISRENTEVDEVEKVEKRD